MTPLFFPDGARHGRATRPDTGSRIAAMATARQDSPAADQDNAIERITHDRGAHYEPFGWHHWPKSPWFSYQFRRGLGETQEGGGAVSEVFQAASRIDPAKGVKCTLRLLDAEETGAEHCQHDNPTIGQEILADWLAGQFGIDQRKLLKLSSNPLI